MSLPAVWAYALEILVHTGAGVITLYISTSPALVTKADDTPPSTIFSTGLIQPGNYQVSCFSDGKTFGKASMGFGEIILDNSLGEYDYILDYAFDGRPAILRRIDADLCQTAAYPSAWTIVFTGTLTQPAPAIQGYNQGTITIPWRDRMIELQKPLPLATFLGDNALPDGLEGTADDLANTPKPLVIGQVYEIAPVCCNTARLIYAVSPPAVGMTPGLTGQDSITDWDAIMDFDGLYDIWGMRRCGIANVTVYDSGVEIAQGPQYSDMTEMMGSAPAAGYCRVLQAHGYVRFGSTPSGQVTVSCTDFSGQRNSIGSLIRSVLRDYMLWDNIGVNGIDLVNLDTVCTQSMGAIVQDSGETIDQLLDYFCQSLGICYYFDCKGIFRAFQIKDPSLLTADAVLNDLHIISITSQNYGNIPVKTIRIKQQKCWTVQTSGVAGSVSAARRGWIGNQWRVNSASSADVATKHLLSQILEFESAFSVDAQSEAERRLAIYSVRRLYLDVVLDVDTVDITTLQLGMVCNLPLGGRFGYPDKNMLLIGIATDIANKKTTITLWG